MLVLTHLNLHLIIARRNMSAAWGCQYSAMGCLIEDKKSKSKKGYMYIYDKMHFELSSLTLWIALWIVNTYSEFQVNIFNNKREITICQSFCMTTTMLRLYQYPGFSLKTVELELNVKIRLKQANFWQWFYVTNTWTNNTITNCHFYNNVHTFTF